MKPLRLALVLVLALPELSHAKAEADKSAPVLDIKRIVNESYNFRKNEEPEMTEDEYALYERVVAMIPIQPDFALKLLQTMTSGGEQKSPAFEFVLGNIYFTNNHVDLAEAHYRKAIEKFPEFVRAWSNLGALLYGQGRYDEAAECLTKTIAHGERDAHSLGLLAFCLAKTGRKLGAEMDYIQAIGLEPDNSDYLEGLLSLYYENKQFPAAEMLLKQLIKLKPEEKRNWLLYANILNGEDRKVEAIAMLESADALGFLDTDGLLMLSDLYARQQFFREATDTFRRLKAKSPDLGGERLLAFAQSLIADHQLRPAEDALAAVGEPANAHQAVTFFQVKADLQVARKDLPQATETLDHALALDPLDGRTLLALGRLYKNQNEFSRADLALESAARQPVFAYRADIELADVALKTRRYSRALEFLEKAAGIEKSFALQQYIAKIKLVIPENENPTN